MGDRDILFAVRNSFQLGAWNNAINEASDLEGLSDAESIDKDAYVYRSYLALGSHDLVISEITDSAAMGLIAIKLLAKFQAGKVSEEEALQTIGNWMADPACNRNHLVLIAAATVYAAAGNYVEALKACHSGVQHLELMALAVQVFLKMDRLDKAEQTAKAMSAIDDDATISQLATAWVGVQLGGAKVQEAQYIYQELGDKFNYTPSLYNGLAVSRMKQGEWEDAERDLLEALGKDAKDHDTLANLVTVGLHLGKNTSRYAAQLKMLAPQHPMAARAAAAEEAFDRAAAAMA